MVATDEPVSEASKAQQRGLKGDLHNVFHSTKYQVFIGGLLLVALFLPDISVLAQVSDDRSVAVDSVMFLIFVTYALDIVLFSFIKPGYISTVPFWMDVVCAWTVLIEVELVRDRILPSDCRLEETLHLTSLPGLPLAPQLASDRRGYACYFKVIRILRLLRCCKVLAFQKVKEPLLYSSEPTPLTSMRTPSTVGSSIPNSHGYDSSVNEGGLGGFTPPNGGATDRTSERFVSQSRTGSADTSLLVAAQLQHYGGDGTSDMHMSDTLPSNDAMQLGWMLTSGITNHIAAILLVCVIVFPNLKPVAEDTSMGSFVSSFYSIADLANRTGVYPYSQEPYDSYTNDTSTVGSSIILDSQLDALVDNFMHFYEDSPLHTRALSLRVLDWVWRSTHSAPDISSHLLTMSVSYDQTSPSGSSRHLHHRRLAQESEGAWVPSPPPPFFEGLYTRTYDPLNTSNFSFDSPLLVQAVFDRSEMLLEEAWSTVGLVLVLLAVLAFSSLNLADVSTSLVVTPLSRLISAINMTTAHMGAAGKSDRSGSRNNKLSAIEQCMERMQGIVTNMGQGKTVSDQLKMTMTKIVHNETIGSDMQQFITSEFGDRTIVEKRTPTGKTSQHNRDSGLGPRGMQKSSVLDAITEETEDANASRSKSGSKTYRRSASFELPPAADTSEGPKGSLVKSLSNRTLEGGSRRSDSGREARDRVYNEARAEVISWIAPKTGMVDYESLNSWHFNVFILSPKELIAATIAMFDQLGVVQGCDVDLVSLVSFLECVRSLYKENPYHCWQHAVDVMHTTFRMLMLAEDTAAQFEKVEQLALLVAAICHDIEHPGRSNAFLITTKHKLALRYNDVSVLENRHSAVLFKIVLGQKDCDLFSKLTAEQLSTCRKLIIYSIMQTDMTHHFQMITSLEKKVSDESIHVIETVEDHNFVAALFLHAADISHVLKPWNLHLIWSHRVANEFFKQGDEEKAKGLPVSPLCDRDTVVLSKSQLGFIEYVAAPLFRALFLMCPEFKDLIQEMLLNRRHWIELYSVDVHQKAPSELKGGASIEDWLNYCRRTDDFEKSCLAEEKHREEVRARWKIEAPMVHSHLANNVSEFVTSFDNPSNRASMSIDKHNVPSLVSPAKSFTAESPLNGQPLRKVSWEDK